MKTSDSQIALVGSLFAARQEFPVITKEKQGQAGNRTFKYAPLEVIKDAIEPILVKHGLMITQPPDGHSLITRLEHISGEWREGVMPMNAEHANMQSYGIEATYRRRYSYCMMLGIVTEEDTDGAGARGRKTGVDFTAEKPERKRTGVMADVLETMPPLPDEQKEYLTELAEKVKRDKDSGIVMQVIFERLEKEALDNDQKIYLASLLPSNINRPLKAISEARSAKTNG